MKKEFELPKYWYLKITPNILDEVNHFRINIAKYSMGNIDDKRYPLLYEDGSGGSPPTNKYQVELSLSDFRQYVLKTSVVEPIIINEDLTYLGKFLKDLNIT